MKSKKAGALILATLMLSSSVLAGCAGSDKPSGNAEGAGGKDVPVITIKTRLDNKGYFEAKVKEFNETHDDVQVAVQQRADTTDQEHNLLLTQLSSGSSETDILLLDTCWLLEFAAAGWLEPIDKYLPAGYNDDFLPIAKDLTSYNGTQYGILRQVDLSSLYYRKDLFKEKGLSVPETWDELIEVGKELTTDGMWGYVWQGKQYEGLVCDWVEILHSLGGSIFDDYNANPGDREVTINSPEAIRAVEYMYDFLNVSKISPEGVLSYTEDSSREAFQSGQAAMLRLWQSTPPYLSDPETSNVADKWAMAPLPGGENGSRTCIGGWAWGINAFSENKEAAWEVLDWFTSADFMAGQVINLGNQPSRISAYDHELIKNDPLWSELCPMFLEIAKTGTPRPLSVVWTKESDVIQRALHSVFTDEKDAATAVADAAAEIEKIEQEFKAAQK